MDDPNLILQVVFYRSKNNKEPVREWLKSLSQEEKKLIGEATKTVQFSYPIYYRKTDHDFITWVY